MYYTLGYGSLYFVSGPKLRVIPFPVRRSELPYAIYSTEVAKKVCPRLRDSASDCGGELSNLGHTFFAITVHNLILPEVVVHVEDVGEQRSGGVLLHLDLVHLVVHDDGLARDRLSRTAHVQYPRQPLQEQGPHLHEWIERSTERY